jgi:hypothetical protein
VARAGDGQNNEAPEEESRGADQRPHDRPKLRTPFAGRQRADENRVRAGDAS